MALVNQSTRMEFAFYLPATVKITLGPKYVLSAAYLSIYGGFLMSVVGLIQVLFE